MGVGSSESKDCIIIHTSKDKDKGYNMTENEMIAKLLEIFPNMSIGEDNDGQLIVYTDMQLSADSQVEPFAAS